MNKKIFLFVILLITQNICAVLHGKVVKNQATVLEIKNRKCCLPFGKLSFIVKESIRYDDKDYIVLLKGVSLTEAINPFIRAEMDLSSFHGCHLNRALYNIIKHEISAELIFTREGGGWFNFIGIIIKDGSIYKEPRYFPLGEVELLSKMTQTIAEIRKRSFQNSDDEF